MGVVGVSKTRQPVVLSMNLGGKGKSKSTKDISTAVAAAESAEGSGAATVVPSVFSKKVSANIAKWGERKGELLSEGGEEEDKSPSLDKAQQAVTPISAPTESKPVATFASGTKCLLCRRQFTSVEQLQRHERESQLHAENVAKAAKAAKSSAPLSSAAGSQPYRDRASERRGLYGQSANPEDAIGTGGERRKRGAEFITPSLPAPPDTDTVPVAVSDDVTNPGNQLLRRMGWNDGKGLGKDESGRVESIAVAAGSTSSRPPQSKVGVGNAEAAAIPSLEYGDAVTYKNSVIKATRARFDQVSGDGR